MSEMYRIVIIFFEEDRGYSILKHNPDDLVTEETLQERINECLENSAEPKKLEDFRGATTGYDGIYREYWLVSGTLRSEMRRATALAATMDGEFVLPDDRPVALQLERAIVAAHEKLAAAE